MGLWRFAVAPSTVALVMGSVAGREPRSDVQVSGIAEQWIAAFNRRDAEQLVGLADPSIAFSPTVLAGGRRTYCGHQGVRDWISDLEAAGAVHTVRVAEVRECQSGDVLLVGDILLEEEPVSAFTLHLTLDKGLVVEGHGYLTDEQLLLKLGLTEV